MLKKKDGMINRSEKNESHAEAAGNLLPQHSSSSRRAVSVYQTKYRALQARRCAQALEQTWWERDKRHGFDRVSWSLRQDIPQSLAPRETL